MALKVQQLADSLGFTGDLKGLASVVASVKASQSSSGNVQTLSSTVRIALVSEVETLSKDILARVAAAMQKQVTRDVAPIWNVNATVETFPTPESVPGGYGQS